MLADFFTPFIAVGLAELGDKTQIALVLLASKTNKRLHVLTGALLAFLIADGVAIALGSWVSAVVPLNTMKLVSAFIFMGFGVLMIYSRNSGEIKGNMPHNPFVSSFLLISLTEWGDKTQIAAGLFASKYEPVMVLAGTMIALTLLSLMAVLTGGFISKRIDPEKTGVAAGVLFILIGLITLII